MWARGVVVALCLLLFVDASGGRVRFGFSGRSGIPNVPDVGNYTDAAGDAVDNATQTIVMEAEAILSKYGNVMIAAAIPIGIVGVFLGYYLFKPFLFVAGFSMGGGFCYLAVKSLTEGYTAQSWATIAATVVGGLFCGILAVKAVTIGLFLMGASVGGTIALVLRRTMLYSKIDANNPQIALYGAVAVLGVVCGFAALCLEKEMVIIATSYGGAFGATYGIGHFAGHFPDLHTVDETYLSNGYMWIYFSCFVVLGTAGCVVQFGITSKKNHRTQGGWWRVHATEADYESSEERNRRDRSRHDAPRPRHTRRYEDDEMPPQKDINLNVVVGNTQRPM